MFWLEMCIYGFILGGLLMHAIPDTFSLTTRSWFAFLSSRVSMNRLLLSRWSGRQTRVRW